MVGLLHDMVLVQPLLSWLSTLLGTNASNVVYKLRMTRHICVVGSASQKIEPGDGDASVYDVVDESRNSTGNEGK